LPIPTPTAPARRPDPARVAEAHALRQALAPFPTLQALQAAPEWPALSARIAALLDGVRVQPHPSPQPPDGETRRVRVAQWNIEHGNRFEAILQALLSRPGLAGADLVTLNEVDLGMARSGNRDVAAELGARLGLHAAWASMFLESTRGRDDDALTAVPDDNAESLFGLAILSRWPISATRLVPLPGPERALFERERMSGRFVALVCDIAHPIQPFVAVTAHLEVHRTRAHRARQMRLLLRALADESRPVVLAGDWNTHTFDRGDRRAISAAAWPLLAWPNRPLAARLCRPDRGRFRESVFNELRAAGFDWEPYNDDVATLSLRFSRLREVHVLPGPLRAIASHGLRWAERRARLRLDWIAARGFHHAAGSGRTLTGLDGTAEQDRGKPPGPDHAPLGPASDHAPIVAELEFESPAPALT
jgi:endonuclease/exonuclease/phosphatase family metal-dependent hydrolase